MQFAFLLVMVSYIHIHPVEPFVARTCVSCWHELYILRGESHDFIEMMSPPSDTTEYYACSTNDIIRCIAKCDVEHDTKSIQMLAEHPDYMEATSLAIHEMIQNMGFQIHDKSLKKQPKWLMECHFNNLWADES